MNEHFNSSSTSSSQQKSRAKFKAGYSPLSTLTDLWTFPKHTGNKCKKTGKMIFKKRASGYTDLLSNSVWRGSRAFRWSVCCFCCMSTLNQSRCVYLQQGLSSFLRCLDELTCSSPHQQSWFHNQSHSSCYTHHAHAQNLSWSLFSPFNTKYPCGRLQLCLF